MEPEGVRIGVEGGVGRIRLDRPQAINALTIAMCRAMTRALADWRGDPAVEAVVIDHAEGRGFCAGGDVTQVRRSALEDGGAAGRAFFFEEYRLNHLLFTYPKPVAALMDGITMGGGAGISLPCAFRVATPNTVFAMPETAIGFFPDVGSGWYLARLPGRIGQFLALTGARLDGAECLWAGLATHYLPAEALDRARERICARPSAIAAILAELSAEPPPARLAGNAERIARCFALDRYEEILAALEAEGPGWGVKELATLRGKSPQSCKVTLHHLAEGASFADFAQVMRQEYRIASRLFMTPDFAEGVRAVLVDKTGDPRWSPSRPEEVSEGQVEAFFAPLPEEEEWRPL